jgi:hypothetical protein
MSYALSVVDNISQIRWPRRKYIVPFCLGLALSCFSFVAPAVHVSPHGLGQVLLYPYYTARSTAAGNFYNTLFIVTNTATDTKIVRVRFRESLNGRGVADINVFLVPFDSWTGAVIPATAQAAGPTFTTLDGSCTDPEIGSNPGTLAFTNAQYSGANADGADSSLTRAAEGYIEVFEMGIVTDPTLLAALMPNRVNQFGVKPNCAAVQGAVLDNPSVIAPPTGGLMGSVYIINVLDGTLYPYDATPLDEFTQIPLWSPSTRTAKPSLEDVNPKTSDVLDATGYRHSTWDPAKGAHLADPVSAVLMLYEILNYFVLDSVTASGTDWIVTMPTKPFYVPLASLGGSTASPPFESAFATGGAPDSFGIVPSTLAYPNAGNTQIYDREGASLVGTFDFVPNPPPPLLLFPWTANLLTFNSSNVFAASSSIDIGTGITDGWALLQPYPYPNSHVHQLASTDTPPVTYFGLPMIGFMGNNYTNGTLAGPSGPVLSNYSATSPHRAILRIE